MAHQGTRGIPRRAVLIGAAALVSGLTGCSLRLDRDPEVPRLSAADEVRNTVAAILARTEASGEQSAVLDTLRQAAGPVWAPPSELATPTPLPVASDYTFSDGMHAAAEAVITRFDALQEMRAALADIAVGAVLQLTAARDDRAGALIETMSQVPAESPGTASPAPAHTAGPAHTSGTAQDASPTTPDPGTENGALSAFALACYQASYGYERAAVLAPAGTPAGARMRTRISELDTAADLANERLAARGGSAAENRPAWQLAADPAQTGPEQAARNFEDGLISRIEPLFSTGRAPRLGLAALWQSADARSVFGDRQVLRFQITDPATATPTEG